MDDDANIQIKKGMRKSKKDPQPPPEPTEDTTPDQDEEETPAVEVPTAKPKKATKKSAPKVETQDYEVEQQPDVVIHKRHKGAKPRKVIVITADSDANTSDEELPYRARPQVQVKPRPKVSAPASAGAGDPKPAKPKTTKPPVVPVQKVSQKPNADVGAGLPERYAMTQKPKQGYVVDEFIDKLLGLS
jgi:hypothetical protein